MSSPHPLVTVVTITYNLVKAGRQDNIRQCIESVHAQDYPNIEHLVIDGASTDGTLDILRPYEDKGWLRVLSEPDSGIYDAMNKGVAHSHGEFIAFLNSDDFWHDARGVSLSVEALLRDHADWSMAPAYYVDDLGHRIGILDPVIGAFFVRMPACHQSMFVRRSVFSSLGGFDTRLKSSSDFDFVLRMSLAGTRFTLVSANFTSYRFSGLSAQTASFLGDAECADSLHRAFSKFMEFSLDEAHALFDTFTMSKAKFEKLKAHLAEPYRCAVDAVDKECVESARDIRFLGFAKLDRTRPLRVLFDATLLSAHDTPGANRTGIFFATYHILRHLAEVPDIDLLLYTEPYATESISRLLGKSFPGRNNIRLFENEQFHVFFSPYYEIPARIRDCGVPCYAMLFDTIVTKFPQFFRPEEVRLFRAMVSSYPARTGFFAISEQTKSDFVSEYNLQPERILVTPLAADALFRPITSEDERKSVLNRYKIRHRRFIFSLCSIEPRKNLIYALENFAEFICRHPDSDLIFVLGGTQWDAFADKFAARLSRFDRNLRERIIRIGYVHDEHLPALYSSAFAFVYPSLYEGFGLPPLEAMQCGCPVIASNRSSLPEVIGDAGILIDIDQPFAMADALDALDSNPTRWRQMHDRGLNRARMFSWSKTALSMAGLFRRQKPGELFSLDNVVPGNTFGRTLYGLFGRKDFLVAERSVRGTKTLLMGRYPVCELNRTPTRSEFSLLGLPLLSFQKMPGLISVYLFKWLKVFRIDCRSPLVDDGSSRPGSFSRWLLRLCPSLSIAKPIAFARLSGYSDPVPSFPICHRNGTLSITEVLTDYESLTRRLASFSISESAKRKIDRLAGHKGQIVLLRFADGELRYSEAVFHVGDTISFSSPPFRRNFFGFSFPEAWGCWTQEDSAGFLFRLSGARSNVKFIFSVNPHLTPSMKRLVVRVRINRKHFARWVFISSKPLPDTSLTIPAKAIPESGILVFEFIIRTPKSPLELGIGSDPRRLGLAFSTLHIEGEDNAPCTVRPPNNRAVSLVASQQFFSLSGFGEDEGGLRWAIGEAPSISWMARNSSAGFRTAILRIRFLGASKKTPRRVRVQSHGKKIARWTATNDNWQNIAISIPRTAIGPDGRVTLTFHPMNPVSPKALGIGPDDRKLAFAVKAIRVRKS